MRRMNSVNDVIDIVNEAIDEGQIEVGGLPQIQEGDAGKVLTVNSGETGVEWGNAGGVSPEQEAILDLMKSDNGKLGIYSNGVIISDANGDNVNFDFYIDEDNVANINSDYPINLESQAGVTINDADVYPVIELNFANSDTLIIDKALYNKLTAANSKYVIKFNSTSSNHSMVKGTYFTQTFNNPLVYQGINPSSYSNNDPNGFLAIAFTQKGVLTFAHTSDKYKVTISQPETGRIIYSIGTSLKYFKTFYAASGTDTSASSINGTQGNFFHLQYIIPNQSAIMLHVKYMDISNTTTGIVIHAEGFTATTKYVLEWNVKTGAYTITDTAI